VPTQPGTDINVTPESDVPIIPNATTNQGDLRFALKKVWLVAPFEVINAILNNNIKYKNIIENTIVELI